MMRPEHIPVDIWERMSWHAREQAEKAARPPRLARTRRREARQVIGGQLTIRRTPDGWYRISDGICHAYTLTEAGAWSFAYLLGMRMREAS